MSNNQQDFSKNFPTAIHKELGFYVYIYVDLSKDIERVIYVGKGAANRCFDHLQTEGADEKSIEIRKLAKSGGLRIDILVFGVNEATALKIEAAVIDLIGVGNLLNKKRGHEAIECGRITTDDLVSKLYPSEIDHSEFVEDCILIRINQSYRSGMSEHELYEVTRGIWVVGEESCKKVKYAMAVSDGIIREVYTVAGWFSEGTTMYSTRSPNSEKQNRHEFVGRIANDSIRKKFLHKSVGKLWDNGAQNPITYFGPNFDK